MGQLFKWAGIQNRTLLLVLPLVRGDVVLLILCETALQVYVRFLNRLDTCQAASQMSLSESYRVSRGGHFHHWLRVGLGIFVFVFDFMKVKDQVIL